jgi:uncharacterized protein (DUF1330 family)
LTLPFHSSAADGVPQPKAYVVLEITVHDAAMYEQYRQKVEPVIEQYGGRYLIRSGAKAFDDNPDSGVFSPEGQWMPDRIIVLEFDSKAAIQAFVSSPEYKDVVPLRLRSATTRSLVASGYRQPQ